MFKNLHINVLVNISLIITFLLFGILATISQIYISRIEEDSSRLTSLRTPTAEASAYTNIALHQSLAALRGWMLIGEERFIKERANSWQTIRKEHETLVSLSIHWTNAENVKRLSKVTTLLNQLEQEQMKIELIAHKPENIQSSEILLSTAIPLATSLVNDITVMIDFAKSQEASAKRLSLFSAMADFRGSFTLCLADIRAFLLSGDKNFEESFKMNWAKNKIYYKKLNSLSKQMNEFERGILKNINLIRKKFSFLPKKMFSSRNSPEWNQANFLLKTTAVVTSNKLVKILHEMVNNQNKLLEQDVHLLIQETKKMEIFLVSMLCFSIFTTIYFRNIINKKYRLFQNEIHTRDFLVDQNVLLVIYNQEGFITSISNALCRKLGGVKDDFIGKKHSFLIEDEMKEEILEDISKSIMTGESWRGEFKNKLSEDNELWLSSTIIPVKNSNKNEFHNILEDITNHKLIEEVSVTDALTSLYNRRKFDEILKHEIKLSRRRKSNLSLAIIDVDHFKYYNDQYGHPAGDKVLTKIAATIRASLSRPDDYVFRIGGEEFSIIFNDLDKKSTKEILDKIRTNVEQLKIEHSESSVLDYVTISIGAKVCVPDELSNSDTLYGDADSFLYNAKQTRNIVIVG